MLLDLMLMAGSYLLGSVSTAVIVCRVTGLPDPRAGGSGNPGATNVLRLGGKTAAAITLAGDVLKGVLPVLVARLTTDSHAVLAAVAVLAFLGHLFPIFFQFRGGKGVATALGAITALAWPVGLALGITWLLVAIVSRYSSLSSMMAATFAPLYAALMHFDSTYVIGLVVMSALLLYRHKGNVARLMAGEESRLSF